MNAKKTAPVRLGLAIGFNVVMVVAVGALLVSAELGWQQCLADVDAGATPLWRCQDQMTNAQLTVFALLLPVWVVTDLAIAAAWAWRRRGARTAPAG